MDKGELIERLKQQRRVLEQELTQQIVNIENITASIQALEGTENSRAHFPPQNSFEGVPIRRIDSDTYINIARHLIDNKKNIRTPGVRGQPLVRELNIRIQEVGELIHRLDNRAEQLIGTSDPQLARDIQRIQDDRDKLRIELEFYKDSSEAVQTEPRRLSREELEEEKYKAREWWERRNPNKK
jgi:hypothetical protein